MCQLLEKQLFSGCWMWSNHTLYFKSVFIGSWRFVKGNLSLNAQCYISTCDFYMGLFCLFTVNHSWALMVHVCTGDFKKLHLYYQKSLLWSWNYLISSIEYFPQKQNWISETPSPSTSPESAHPIYLQLIWFKNTLISATRQESNKINQRAWTNVKLCEVKVQLCFWEELVLKPPQLNTSFIWMCQQEILFRKLVSKHYHSVSQLTAHSSYNQSGKTHFS